MTEDSMDMDVADVPKVVGRCVIGPCSKQVFSNDIEAVELEKRGEFACAVCALRLLTLKPTVPDMDKPPKMGKLSRHRPGPRLHKGEDLRR